MPPGGPTGPPADTPEPKSVALVHAEARRLAAESGLEADPARLAEGWQRRFVIEGARVADSVRLYESLGFEVLADPVRGEDVMKDCKDCRIAALLDFRMIYTRPRRADPGRTQPIPGTEPAR